MAGELLALCTTGLPAAAAAAAGGEEAGAPLRQQEAPVGWATALLDRGVSPRVAYGVSWRTCGLPVAYSCNEP